MDPSTVTVWLLPDPGVLTPHQEAKGVGLFSKVEQERFEKMTHPARRGQYVLGHTLARFALAQNLDCDLSQVPLIFSSLEKPYEAPFLDPKNPLTQNKHMSLSHTDGLIAVAVAAFPVGVDVENREARRHYQLELLSKNFPEKEELLRLPENEGWHRYTDLFSLKEAFHKVTQFGFLAAQSRISFSIKGEGEVLFSCLNPSDAVRFKQLSCHLNYLPSQHVLSVAAIAPHLVEIHILRPSLLEVFS